MYNMGDKSFENRPNIMSRDTMVKTLNRIQEYSTKNRIESVNLVIHGGEPLLVGKTWMLWFLKLLNSYRSDNFKINTSIQTNSILLDQEWINMFKSNDVTIGISLDGYKVIHDKYRLNFRNRGTYDNVIKSIELLSKNTDFEKWAVLTVVNPSMDPLKLYDNYSALGIKRYDLLWPDYHYEYVPPFKSLELAKFFITFFNHWYESKNSDVSIRFFTNIIKMILGGPSEIDAMGPQPLSEIVIETGGSIEPLDVLRICKNKFTELNLNIINHKIEEIFKKDLFQACLNNQALLPEKCKQCEIYSICGGGYMPHRWSNRNGFSNTSIHCKDLYAVISHIENVIATDIEKYYKIYSHSV